MLGILNPLEIVKNNSKNILRRKTSTDYACSMRGGKRIVRKTGLIIDSRSFDESAFVLPQYAAKIHDVVRKATFADFHTLVLCSEDREAALKAACYFGIYKKNYEMSKEVELDDVFFDRIENPDRYCNDMFDEKRLITHDLVVFDKTDVINVDNPYLDEVDNAEQKQDYSIYVIPRSYDLDKILDAIRCDKYGFKIVVVDKSILLEAQTQNFIAEENAPLIDIDPPDTDYYVAVLDKLLESTGINLSDIEKKRTVIQRIKRRYGRNFGEDHVVFHVLKMVARLEAERRETAEVSDFFEDEKGDSALDKLDSMVGLNNVKAVCHEFAALAKEETRNRKLKMSRKNMIFYGKPGTGKTTAAGLFAEILAEVGAGSGVFVRAGRREIVGRYVGHTAPKVASLFDEARGGVLFIDEAGFLTQTRAGGFVEEAVKELVRYMEECPDVCVIFAMYENEVRRFLEMDEGLASRISRMIRFDEYKRSELVVIAEEMFRDRGYFLSKGCDKLIMNYFIDSGIRTGNARDMRNLVEQIIIARSIRLFGESEPEKKKCFITISDVSDGIERYTREHSIVGRSVRKNDNIDMDEFINVRNL